MTEEFNGDDVLLNWDVAEQQRRADFMEFLYFAYERDNSLFTGLWEEFKEDLAQETVKQFTPRGSHRVSFGEGAKRTVPVM